MKTARQLRAFYREAKRALLETAQIYQQQALADRTVSDYKQGYADGVLAALITMQEPQSRTQELQLGDLSIGDKFIVNGVCYGGLLVVVEKLGTMTKIMKCGQDPKTTVYLRFPNDFYVRVFKD